MLSKTLNHYIEDLQLVVQSKGHCLVIQTDSVEKKIVVAQ